MTHVLDFQTLAPPASQENVAAASAISLVHCSPGSSLSAGGCLNTSGLSLVLCS